MKGPTMDSETQPNDSAEEYWFNQRTGLVERGKQSLAIYRIGPFSSYLEASLALQKIQKRNEDWDESEERWNK
jgi:hypothetical protein